MCGDHFSSTNSYAWAITSSFISSAPLIKYCPNTGWHTSLSFTLALVYSTQSPLITSASVMFLLVTPEMKQQMPHFTGGVHSSPVVQHLSLPALTIPGRLPNVFIFTFAGERWSILFNGLLSYPLWPVCQLFATISVSFLHLRSFLLPGELSQYTIQVCRDHRFCSNMLWATKITAPQQKFIYSKGKLKQIH